MKPNIQVIQAYQLAKAKGGNCRLQCLTKCGYVGLLWCCFLSFLLLPESLQAQSYGLRFAGHEEVQENRTSLDLTSERPLCLNGEVELSFDLLLVPDYRIYFGYIFRLIQDDKHNLDLLYDQKSRCFKIIVGERFAPSIIKIDSVSLHSKWNRFRIRFDLDKKSLLVYTNNKLIIKDKVPFSESGCFKLFFGSNEFREFKSKDLPPMDIKDISITENGRQRYFWPLNEAQGTTFKDQVSDQLAIVRNPIWLKALHNEWKLASHQTLQGDASVAFDPSTETVYVVNTQKLYRYSIKKRELSIESQQSSPPSLLWGGQAIFNPLKKKLYHFFVDQKSVSVYDPVAHAWTSETISPNHVKVTEYWQANKFIAGADSCLYILGGYGQLTYKNSIYRYRFPTKQWERLPTTGHDFTPRYLAALGTTPSADTAYIIGGYGSLTGEQMLNPKNSYDLLRYTVKTNTFQKIYELGVPKTDFTFANSLVIDPRSNTFYGLIYPNQQFKSQLQLIRGSLTKPEYEAVGQVIPFQFHDTHAFTDLFYCPVSQKLIAVTLFRNEANSTTDLKIYTISFPPNKLETAVVAEKNSSSYYWLLAIATLLAGGLYWIYARKNRRELVDKQRKSYQPELIKSDVAIVPNPLIQHQEAAPVPHKVEEPAPKASIFFFGNFQVFDLAGNDITKAFTPLLKELFLLLALNSIGKHHGLSSEKLNEILWPDKAGRDAGNNRSVNITKLRNLLEKVGNCSLSKDSGYWKVEVDFTQVYVDFERYVTILHSKNPLTKQTIIELGEITKRGSFLLNTEYYWLDDFKADISNKIINTFLQYADKLSISEDPEFLIQITNYVFYYDPVNEDAIILKCKALALMGKHTLAKNTFEKFTRDYKAIYGEAYEQSFTAILS